MNRSIEDTKYVFHPPKYSRFWASIIYPFADIFFRRRAQKVMSVKAMSGVEDLRRLAVSGDGGGSIRIPASLTGMYGLKPTFGRMSGFGGFPICHTVGVNGPITSSAHDLALSYLATAGSDKFDPNTLLQPTPHVGGATDVEQLNGVTIGVFWPWFENGKCLVCRVVVVSVGSCLYLLSVCVVCVVCV